MIPSTEQLNRIKELSGYRGRNVVCMQFRPGLDLSTYRNVGSTQVFFRINLMDGSCKKVPLNGRSFERPVIVVDALEPGEVIAGISIYGGKETGLYIYTDRDKHWTGAK